VALHVATRMTLIAVATAFLRCVLDGSPFNGAVSVAAQIGVCVFAGGVIAGELARRLIQDTVDEKVQKILQPDSTGSNHQDNTAAVPGV
jgi:hypothetical protein